MSSPKFSPVYDTSYPLYSEVKSLSDRHKVFMMKATELIGELIRKKESFGGQISKLIESLAKLIQKSGVHFLLLEDRFCYVNHEPYIARGFFEFAVLLDSMTQGTLPNRYQIEINKCFQLVANCSSPVLVIQALMNLAEHWNFEAQKCVQLIKKGVMLNKTFACCVNLINVYEKVQSDKSLTCLTQEFLLANRTEALSILASISSEFEKSTLHYDQITTVLNAEEKDSLTLNFNFYEKR